MSAEMLRRIIVPSFMMRTMKWRLSPEMWQRVSASASLIWITLRFVSSSMRLRWNKHNVHNHHQSGIKLVSLHDFKLCGNLSRWNHRCKRDHVIRNHWRGFSVAFILIHYSENLNRSIMKSLNCGSNFCCGGRFDSGVCLASSGHDFLLRDVTWNCYDGESFESMRISERAHPSSAKWSTKWRSKIWSGDSLFSSVKEVELPQRRRKVHVGTLELKFLSQYS